MRTFQGVARASKVRFTVPELLCLLDAANNPVFRDLLTAGFLTDARYGELCACEVRHFNLGRKTLNVPRGKTRAHTFRYVAA